MSATTLRIGEGEAMGLKREWTGAGVTGEVVGVGSGSNRSSSLRDFGKTEEEDHRSPKRRVSVLPSG